MDNRTISELPERTRRTILRISVTVITVVIVTIWFWWLPQTLNQVQNAADPGEKDTALENIRQELENSLQQLRESDKPITTDEQPSNDQVIQAMKDKLSEQQASTTPTSTPIN
jgi:hypothetical protein